MKKILLLIIGCITVFGTTSCTDDDYTSIYANPAETTTASCEKLMTGVFYAGREYTYNAYWRMYTWDNGIMGTYAQTIGFTNSDGSLYSANDSYANNRWENFYNVLTQFRVLQNVYDKLPENEKNTYTIFYNLAEVFVYDHLSQLIDVFGDVPFEEAGYLAITGDVKSSYPSYDSASELYSMMLDKLGSIYSYINSAQGSLNSLTTAYLPAQDFINKGDLNLWMKYCNSLRLRLAMRVASQGTLAAKGKQVVAEILNGGLPIIADASETIQVLPDQDGFNYEENFRDGYRDHSRASQAMLDVLCTANSLGENDPRLPIMYSKNSLGEYKGLSTSESYADQQTNTSLPESQRVYSRIDSTTVIFNKNLRSPIIMAAEVDFMRAEAYQKGWATGDAKQAYVNGMLHSTQFYFGQTAVSESSYGTTMAMPDEADVIAFAHKSWDAAANKEAAILSQKWLNFGYMQPTQAWCEIRRTGYPNLYYPTDANAQILKTLPDRVRYPSSERNNNKTHYEAQVQAMGGDDAYKKVFWAQ